MNPTLAGIEEAWSVEALTKKFFTSYAGLLEEICRALDRSLQKAPSLQDEFSGKAASSTDIARKLLGQIVFLYFLQKKGWLGVAKEADWGTGPRDFLRRLARAEYGNYANFFNDVLEPLFYDALATDRGHHAWCPRFQCRIPFLSSGLFEPLGGFYRRNIDLNLPNHLFTNTSPAEDGLTGTGILDVLDRYNFTLNEAGPLDQEAAIDPEMLGKVFENLIEDNRRKGLGSYYTPREIVRFMCVESLITYLHTTLNAHEEIVPRSDLETLVRPSKPYSFSEAARQSSAAGKSCPKLPPSIARNARLIDNALAAITVCDPAVGSGAFPVGIMTEIVRVRCALTPCFNHRNERSPYHFKRHAIQNCFYGVDIDSGAIEIARLRLWLSLIADEEDVKRIQPLPNLEDKIVAGNSLLSFPLFSEVFRRKGGFDIVIGNPPYISAVKEAQDPDNQRWAYKKLYPILKGAFDLYVVFLLLADKITSPRGCYAWIVPNKLLVADYAREIVAHLRATGLHTAVDVSTHQVFEAGIYPIVIFADKSSPQTFTRYAARSLNDLHVRRLTAKSNHLRQYTTFKEHGIKFGSGATGFQAQDLARCLSETPQAQSIPFVVSGCIDRYSVSFRHVRYMGKTYPQAHIANRGGIAAGKWSFWQNGKIVIAGMTKKIEAVYVRAPLALGVGVYAIADFGGFLPQFLVGVLNSKFLSYFLRQKFSDKHLAGGYLAINKSTLEQLPLIGAPQSDQEAIATLVEQIIAAKSSTSAADTTSLEQEIDDRVYALYGLTAQEIDRVEHEAENEAKNENAQPRVTSLDAS